MPDSSDKSGIAGTSHSLLSEFTPHPYQSLNAFGVIITVNQTWLDLLGYRREEVEGVWFGSFLSPDSRERFESNCPEFESSGDVSNIEFEMIHADGHTIVVSFDGQVERDENGDFRRTHCQFCDISQRKEREQQLELREAYLEHSHDVITVVDAEGEIQYTSESAIPIIDLPTGERLMDVAEDLVHEADREEIANLLEATRERPKTVTTAEIRVRKTDGMWGWIEARGVNKLDDPLIEGILISAREITEQKNRERQIQRERNRFSALFNRFPEPTVAVTFEDETAILEDVNPAFEAVFGYEAAEVIGKSINDLIVPEVSQTEAENINRRAKAQELIDQEVTRITVGGPRDFLFRNISVPGEREPDTYGVYVDITDRKQREREIKRQNERLDEFANVVSHDLRNPLTVARGRAEFVRDECDSGHFEPIIDALDRMETIIQDTLTLAQQGDTVGETEPLPISDVTEMGWNMVDTEEARLINEDEFTIQSDLDRLQHIFENLFRNAIEHGGEEITVRVGLLDEEGFYVADNGKGFSGIGPEKAFELGHSSESDGTGFGLTIVKQIAEAHGWEVSGTEADSGGAQFEFTGVEIL